MPKQPLAKSKPTQALAITPTWDRARQLLDLVRGYALGSLAAQAMLGLDLIQRKKELGIRPGQPKKEFRHDGGILSWKDRLKQELDISETTARRFMEAGTAVKARLKKLNGGLMPLLEKAPSQLTQAERDALFKAVAKATDGQTQAELLLDLKLVKAPQGHALKGGHHPGAGDQDAAEPDEQQLAWDFLSPAWEQFALLTDKNPAEFQRCLHTLPLTGDPARNLPGLLDLENHAQTLLDTIKDAKSARMAGNGH